MNIQKMIESGSNALFVVSGGDLQEFALSLIFEAQKLKESEKKDEVYLSADEAAKELQITKPTLWRWDKNNYLKPVKLGRRCLYRLSDIDNLRSGGRCNR